MIQVIGRAIKKPVEINWFRWNGFSQTHGKELMEWVQSFGVDFTEHFVLNIEKNILTVNTLEGVYYNIPKGYIIIRGVKGEFYPCDVEIFNETYNIIENNVSR